MEYEHSKVVESQVENEKKLTATPQSSKNDRDLLQLKNRDLHHPKDQVQRLQNDLGQRPVVIKLNQLLIVKLVPTQNQIYL